MHELNKCLAAILARLMPGRLCKGTQRARAAATCRSRSRSAARLL